MLLHQTSLFKSTNIPTGNYQLKTYPANYTIELEGSESTYVAIVLKGTIGITSYNASGTSIHLQTLGEGMVVGDVLLFGSKQRQYPGNLLSVTPSEVAIIPYDTILSLLETNEQFRINFLTTISQKAYQYSIETKLLSQDTLRDKILQYLTLESKRQNTNRIQLNMTKEELAKKLHVQRPSLSRELANMKQEGILDYNRWIIELK